MEVERFRQLMSGVKSAIDSQLRGENRAAKSFLFKSYIFLNPDFLNFRAKNYFGGAEETATAAAGTAGGSRICPGTAE